MQCPLMAAITGFLHRRMLKDAFPAKSNSSDGVDVELWPCWMLCIHSFISDPTQKHFPFPVTITCTNWAPIILFMYHPDFVAFCHEIKDANQITCNLGIESVQILWSSNRVTFLLISTYLSNATNPIPFSSAVNLMTDNLDRIAADPKWCQNAHESYPFFPPFLSIIGKQTRQSKIRKEVASTGWHWNSEVGISRNWNVS